MPTILTLAVDQYDDHNQLVASHICARASNVVVPADDVFASVTAALPPTWRQMTYDELVDHFGKTRGDDSSVWTQLSLF